MMAECWPSAEQLVDTGLSSPNQINSVQHSGVRVERRGATGVFTLDRGRARNAVTAAMIADMSVAIPKFARDPDVYGVVIRSAVDGMFSAGGDLRELAGIGGPPAASLDHEYEMVWLLECFSKPTVSLIGGPVMGSGVGLSLFGTHRVAGEGYRFSMPETAIGLFPDVGAAHVFARMPDQIGLYLGLTGRAIGPADALALGLVTHVIPTAQFADIEALFADVQPIDEVLDSRHAAPAAGELERHRATIARAFSAATVAEIVARLRAETRDTEWAHGVAADLATRAPLALEVTLHHIRRASDLDLRHTLQADSRVMNRMLRQPDFREGVRALLIDKDKNPRWQPSRLAEVTPEMIERMFEPAPGTELVLPTRQEMQAARV
jgi:enoyl-CoA hydratase